MLSRYLSISLLLVFSLCCVTFYYSIGMGHAYFSKANYAVNSWTKPVEKLQTENIDVALNAIDEAIAFDNNNPHYFETKAALLDVAIFKGMLPHETNNDIKSLYLKSITLRKTWPETWVNLAMTNSYLHGINEETLNYLDNAFKYGPYDTYVIKNAISLLMPYWQTLSPNARYLLFAAIERSAGRNKHMQYVLNQAKQHNLLNLICYKLSNESDLSNINEQWAYRKHCT